MPNQTPFFQAFGPLLFGRPARAALARLKKLDSLQELYAIFGELFPQRLLSPSEKGVNSRRRSLPAQVTFWAFVWQVLKSRPFLSRDGAQGRSLVALGSERGAAEAFPQCLLPGAGPPGHSDFEVNSR